MDSIAAFLAMGGYARFVWPVYGLAALALVVLLVASLKAMRGRERELAESERHRRRGRGDETQA
jgi:heme exporter protein D